MTDQSNEEDRPPRKVYWAARQWCVTDYGLETIQEHRYFMDPRLLAGLTDHQGDDGKPIAEAVRHICEKSWVDIEDLFAAFAVAIQIHDIKLPPGALRNAMIDARESRRHDEFYMHFQSSRFAEHGVRPDHLLGTTMTESLNLTTLAEAEVIREKREGRDFLEIGGGGGRRGN